MKLVKKLRGAQHFLLERGGAMQKKIVNNCINAYYKQKITKS